MHIEFKRIILHNFMSFGHADLRIEDDGFIKVSGLNENPLDNAGSNGSGKSSLWEAIVWAITGETIRGTKHVVNIYGEDGCFVDIEFYIDKTRYQIIRSKDHKVRKTSLLILVNGTDVSGKGIRDSEKILQQYLPDLTPSLLGSVIILGQGLPQKFTNNTPSGRKEVLEKLSKSDFMIEDLKQRVADRKSTLLKEQRDFEDTVTSLQGKVKVLNEQIIRDTDTLHTLDKSVLEHELEETDAERSEVSAQLEGYADSIVKVESELSDLNNALLKLNDEQSAQLDKLKDCALSTTIQECSDDISRLKSEKYTLEAELRNKLNIKDICPTCGQKLPDVVKPDVSGTRIKLEEVTFKLSTASDEYTKLTEQYTRLVSQIKDGYSRTREQAISHIDTTKRKLQEFKLCVSQKTTRLNNLNTQYSEIHTKLSYIESTISTLTNNILRNQEEIKLAEEQILYNNMQKDLTKSHLDIVNKFDTALKRDFRGYLLSTVINYIEARAMQYCKLIFDTTNISFCLDGNNIDISYMNKVYENLSGGEKQKIDLIIQFSIRDMLLHQLNFTSNILVLDEVFDGLDMLGCNKVIDMISQLSDVKNVFIVTHRKDLSIPSDKELLIVKSSAGISEIR